MWQKNLGIEDIFAENIADKTHILAILAANNQSQIKPELNHISGAGAVNMNADADASANTNASAGKKNDDAKTKIDTKHNTNITGGNSGNNSGSNLGGNLGGHLDGKPHNSYQFALTSKTLAIADNSQNLEQLKNAIENFKELAICKTATNAVFADGNEKAKIMLIGEAPGATEDEKGIPFCGDSGKLMDKIFAYAGFLRKQDLYITNSVFWRPPGNRKPTEEENEACKPLVEKHIALIKPQLIIAIGATAASVIIPEKARITKLRGKYYQYKNKYLQDSILTTALFHPSYLLRNPSKKKDFFLDILKIKEYLQNIPSRV